MASSIQSKSPEEFVGELLSCAMSMSQMTVSELSRRSGVSRPAVGQIYNSKHDCKLSTFFRLLEACGVECEVTLYRTTCSGVK